MNQQELAHLILSVRLGLFDLLTEDIFTYQEKQTMRKMRSILKRFKID